MRAKGLRQVGVVEGERLVGTLELDTALEAQDDSPVFRHMNPEPSTLPPATPVREASRRFIEDNLDAIPVATSDRFFGFVTSAILLQELGRSWDPLTELNWSDSLRSWGVGQLKRGHEISIIFIDLDGFGQFNKKYGHVVGDRVLKRVAQELREAINPEREILVRYGGDEFAIGTLRDRDMSLAFAKYLERKISSALNHEFEHPVTVSVGTWGGKRTKERENVHFESTLDSLINLASKHCQSLKTQKQLSMATANMGEEDPATVNGNTINVVAVSVDASAPFSPAAVQLSAISTGVHRQGGRVSLEAVCQATIQALEGLLTGVQCGLQRIALEGSPGGEWVVRVSGVLRTFGREFPVEGAEVVGTDPSLAAAQATVSAFAGRPLAVEPEEEFLEGEVIGGSEERDAPGTAEFGVDVVPDSTTEPEAETTQKLELTDELASTSTTPFDSEPVPEAERERPSKPGPEPSPEPRPEIRSPNQDHSDPRDRYRTYRRPTDPPRNPDDR